MSQIDIQEAAHNPRKGVSDLLEKSGVTFEQLGLTKGVFVYRGSREKLKDNWKMRTGGMINRTVETHYFDIMEDRILDDVFVDGQDLIRYCRWRVTGCPVRAISKPAGKMPK